MNYKITTISIIAFSIFVFTTNVQASVSCDFGDGFSVSYNSGVPNPTDASCTLTIENDESSPLTIMDLEVYSASMAFVDTGDNGDDWLCAYMQTATPPDFTGETICVPVNPMILAVGESTSFEMNFIFENTSTGTQGTPDYVGLTDIDLNGVSRIIIDANLGETDWNIDAIDDTNPGTNPETTSKVRGYIYFDDNNNGKRDNNEQGVEGVKIKLQYAGPNDKFDTGDDERYTDKTNEDGKYRFEDLASGAYRLKIEDGQMIEFYLTSEKDTVNGKSSFSLDDEETKERDFGYDRDRDSNGNPKNSNLNYLQSGFTLSLNNIINYLTNLIK